MRIYNVLAIVATMCAFANEVLSHGDHHHHVYDKEHRHLECGTKHVDDITTVSASEAKEYVLRHLGSEPHEPFVAKHRHLQGFTAERTFNRRLGISSAVIPVNFHSIRNRACDGG